MKVLWFSNTASLFDKAAHHYHGGGWIESLEILLRNCAEVELGIGFFYTKKSENKRDGRVTYFPIIRPAKNRLKKLLDNWNCNIEHGVYKEEYLKIIKYFQPDLIHIFGTEADWASIQDATNIPVVVHLQGNVNAYNNAYYPPGINKLSILFSRFFLKNHFLGNSDLFDKKRFEKKAKFELAYFKNAKYFMGRTQWDKNLVSLLSPQAQYFHVDEVLRNIFYNQPPPASVNLSSKVIIFSTISPPIFKGLDVILKTAKLLKLHTTVAFEWHIAGIAGNNKMKLFIEDIIGVKSGDYNIVYKGKLSAEELVTQMQHAMVYVHPSYIDNSPNSVCEAQMLGLPVIACNVGGVATLVKNNQTGVLVPSNGPYELAYQIKALLQDGNLLNSLAQNARTAAIERHDKDKILKQLLHVYTSILATTAK